jgi:ketosteroid isomerase-like protein
MNNFAMKQFIFTPVILLLLLASCTSKKDASDPFQEKQALLDADRAFSKLSGEKGMKAAFIEYIDSNGVLLRPNEMPIIGANAIDYLIQLNDTGFSLTWEPDNGAVSKSGDLGYTFGIYAMKPNAKDTAIYGTYTTIWKKQKDGKWKFVLDSGNEGVGGEHE